MKHKFLKYTLACLAAAGLMLPATAADKVNYQAEYNQLFKEYNNAFQGKDYAKMDALMPKIVSLAGKPGVPGGANTIHNLTVCLTWQSNKRNDESLKRAYEQAIGTVQGDEQVTWLQKYADFLKSKRMGNADEIKKVLDRRYAVKGISSRKLMECYLADGNIAKAESLIPVLMKEDKRKQEEKYKDVISMFRKKGLSALQITKRLYEEYLPTLSGDRKAAVMGEYAGFLRENVLADDAAIDKILADRFNVPGLSDKALMGLYFSKMNKVEETAYWENYKKAKELSKKSPELKNQFWCSIAGSFCPPWNKPAHREDLQKLFGDFPDNDITAWSIHVMRPTIVNAMAVVDYDFTVKMLQKCYNLPDRAKKRMTCSVLADLHQKFAHRHYETPDIAQLHQANVYLEQVISLTDPKASLEVREIHGIRSRIAANALNCKDYNEVRRQVEMIRKENPKTDAVKYLGLAAYEEGNYAEAVRILMPFCENKDRDARVGEYTVRALCALRRYEEADKLMDYMISTNGSTGKGGQYRQEQRHLKLRIEEQKKKQ